MNTTPKFDLLAAIREMDVPEMRRTDFRWLLRNLAIRNSGHPNFPRVMARVKELCR